MSGGGDPGARSADHALGDIVALGYSLRQALESHCDVDTSEPVDLTGLRVLVVEDSWQIGVAMARLLKEMGAEVSGPAANSTDALVLACEQLPDAALIDFSLRRGERAGGLIALLHTLGIHVVLMTGYTDVPAIRHQGIPILHKPFSEAALLASLRPALTQIGGQDGHAG